MQQFGEAEIQYLHLTAGGQEDVCRLDIPMHDPFGMRRGQSVRHLDADIEHLLRLHGMSGDALLQALALQLLHHDEEAGGREPEAMRSEEHTSELQSPCN